MVVGVPAVVMVRRFRFVKIRGLREAKPQAAETELSLMRMVSELKILVAKVVMVTVLLMELLARMVMPVVAGVMRVVACLGNRSYHDHRTHYHSREQFDLKHDFSPVTLSCFEPTWLVT
jgi:hypothetical protein